MMQKLTAPMFSYDKKITIKMSLHDTARNNGNFKLNINSHTEKIRFKLYSFSCTPVSTLKQDGSGMENNINNNNIIL